ncbi:hypothetical protein AVEN_69207-1 [Araneus ventricosus]|uniref:Uncharacterized protein n=1 Tax=Araneus ventricosus TaxID=182803 RepID=A0A4Y2THT5_ARAVE|nr:hypothetical protein AVEN_69207-1 [Araneus ventricosus]
MESSSTFKRVFSPNGNIEKIPAPLGSHISSPNLSPSSGNQTWLLLVTQIAPLSSPGPSSHCGRTPKTFALQGDPSRTNTLPVVQALSLYSFPGRP